MKREDLPTIAQLLLNMQNVVERLDLAQKRENAEEVSSAKRELLGFQKQIDSLL